MKVKKKTKSWVKLYLKIHNTHQDITKWQSVLGEETNHSMIIRDSSKGSNSISRIMIILIMSINNMFNAMTGFQAHQHSFITLQGPVKDLIMAQILITTEVQVCFKISFWICQLCISCIRIGKNICQILIKIRSKLIDIHKKRFTLWIPENLLWSPIHNHTSTVRQKLRGGTGGSHMAGDFWYCGKLRMEEAAEEAQAWLQKKSHFHGYSMLQELLTCFIKSQQNAYQSVLSLYRCLSLNAGLVVLGLSSSFPCVSWAA